MKNVWWLPSSTLGRLMVVVCVLYTIGELFWALFPYNQLSMTNFLNFPTAVLKLWGLGALVVLAQIFYGVYKMNRESEV